MILASYVRHQANTTIAYQFILTFLEKNDFYQSNLEKQQCLKHKEILS